jgi:hypothetical protein
MTLKGCATGLGGAGDADADLPGRYVGEVELKRLGAAEALAQEEGDADQQGQGEGAEIREGSLVVC